MAWACSSVVNQVELPVDVVGFLLRETSFQLEEPFQPFVESRGRSAEHIGGSGANIASNLAVLGAKARLIGTVGNDDVGRQLLSGYEHANLSTQLVRVGRSVRITTLIDPTGDRSFLVDPGDMMDIGLQDMPPTWREPAAALVIPGYNLYWESELFNPVGLEFARLAHERNIPLIVDAASSRLIENSGRDRVRAMLDDIRPTVLSCSDDEAAALGIRPELPSTWLSADVILVHRGAQPTDVLIQQGTSMEARPIPVVPVGDVVDSDGAGDAFLAGFTFHWLRGAGIHHAVELAHEVAARQLQHVGPSLSRGGRGDAPSSESDYRVPPPPAPPVSMGDTMRMALGNRGPDGRELPPDFGDDFGV